MDKYESYLHDFKVNQIYKFTIRSYKTEYVSYMKILEVNPNDRIIDLDLLKNTPSIKVEWLGPEARKLKFKISWITKFNFHTAENFELLTNNPKEFIWKVNQKTFKIYPEVITI